MNSNKLSFKDLSERLKSLIDSESNINNENYIKYDIDRIFMHKDGSDLKRELEDLIDSLNGFSKSKSDKKSEHSFNFYPSDIDGGCHSFCLGIATKKFGHKRDENKNRTGFKGLIKELISYWLTCNLNKTTIILTTDWDNDVFKELWKDIIESNRRKYNHEVEIYLLMEMTREAIQVF
jgi:hypothetical protein